MIQLPRDSNNIAIQMSPAGIALASTYNSSISSSVEITLNTSTTYIEVTAIDKGVFLKWGAVASSSSFDEFIPQNTMIPFVVPVGKLTVQFIQEAATAKLAVVEK